MNVPKDAKFVMTNITIANEMVANFITEYHSKKSVITQINEMRSILMSSMSKPNRNESWIMWRKLARIIIKRVSKQIEELKTLQYNLEFPIVLVSNLPCSAWTEKELLYINNVLTMVNANKTVIADILNELYSAKNNLTLMIDNSAKIRTKRVKSAMWVDQLLDDGYIIVHRDAHGYGTKTMFISDSL
jgi:hypothetical protein